MGYLEELIRAAKEEQRREEEKKAQSAVKPEEVKPQEEQPQGKPVRVVIEEYGNVKIVKVEGEPLLIYEVPVPKPTEAERKIINILKDAAARLIAITGTRFRDLEAKKNFYKQKVLEIIENFPELGIPPNRKEFYAEAVVREMIGYGLLDFLLSDDELEEIMVIGPKRPVYVFHRRYGMMKTNIMFFRDEEIREIIEKIARDVGRRIDIENPLLDARLPDGSRVNATIPPVSVDGSTITIRKFRKDPYTVVDLIKFGTFTPEIAAFLWMAVDGMGAKPANILIAGGTGSGKTTTLNVLAAFIPVYERVISIEDTAELNLPLEHWVRLEARPPGIEGTGEVSMDVLVKNALRMRPDRIIVGEVRHKEAFTLFTAMNTGHDGSMGTIHSNSARDTIVRITSPPMDVPEVMATALDFIVVQHRIHDRRKGTIRRITEIAEVLNDNEKPLVKTIYVWEPKEDAMLQVESSIAYLKTLRDYTGLELSDLEDELQRRTEFLQDLLKRGIRDMKSVKKEVQRYFEEGKKRWQKR
ncbi:MAG: CpaF family protein [Candidatus Diapherotrites archaeon]|nr:CpaF family protein [Candidatus Diapherotrites archaeon]